MGRMRTMFGSRIHVFRIHIFQVMFQLKVARNERYQRSNKNGGEMWVAAGFCLGVRRSNTER